MESRTENSALLTLKDVLEDIQVWMAEIQIYPKNLSADCSTVRSRDFPVFSPLLRTCFVRQHIGGSRGVKVERGGTDESQAGRDQEL